MEAFKVIIPIRYGSTRLPGKPLLEIGNKPLFQHVYESARQSQAEQVIIATDDVRIQEAAGAINAQTIMTSVDHGSGTDRIAEAVDKLDIPDDMIIVNVQGDEFGLPASVIDQLAGELAGKPEKQMATLCEKIQDGKKYRDPNAVKLIVDQEHNAITFSRSPIPWTDQLFSEMQQPAYLHIGLYAYRAGFLKTYATLPVCALERTERLEQLRAIFHGYKIHVVEACESCGIGVDTPEDLERARELAGKD